MTRWLSMVVVFPDGLVSVRINADKHNPASEMDPMRILDTHIRFSADYGGWLPVQEAKLVPNGERNTASEWVDALLNVATAIAITPAKAFHNG